ncbi:hypothetical protein MUN89_12895 [Halobacillus salinarum]|uniref:Group-specific protein n=1 Tax=Halobacillus salinarum TaxID=2932257 RepID=A0ABY4EG37_9BACI|nr:CBO0543 family protein [Halobacillus salinarum]UOQ42858.1 hypothetical protein MUN89_12895 [Halobacillus salinarum]
MPVLVQQMLLAAIIATTLDLILISKGLYSFPVRPFPEVFDIHIGFTLVLLPLSTVFLLFVFKYSTRLERMIMLAICGLAAMLLEIGSEKVGWFKHNELWRHWYSFIGYIIYLQIMWTFFRIRYKYKKN